MGNMVPPMAKSGNNCLKRLMTISGSDGCRHISTLKARPYPQLPHFVIATVLNCTMARGRGGSKGYGKVKTWTRPDPGDRFPKFSLAPYGMSNGPPFYLQGLEEKKVLSLKHIAESRLPRNSEAVCLRLGLQLSESASTMEMGAETLAQLAENDPSTNHWKCFADMAEYFATSKGQESGHGGRCKGA